MAFSVRRHLPEIALILAALFFSFRELGTFPSAWEDSGLYTLVANNIAAGKGYAMPILEHQWAYPYFLSVGPTVIVPVGLFIRAVGFSVESARVVPVLYMLGVMLCFYLYASRIAGRWNARWSTALLISLSAFVNSGKPVLGSVPALFYLLLGLLILQGERTPRRMIVAGAMFGLAMLTKLTFVLVIPALCIDALAAWWRGEKRIVNLHVVTCAAALAVFIPWIALETAMTEHFSDFLMRVFNRGLEPQGSSLVWSKLLIFMRFEYAYFSLLFIAGMWGIARKDLRLRSEKKIFFLSLILLFFAHFLVREGWYRHLLPAHVLLLPFAVAGIERMLGRTWAAPLLALFVVLQGLWQLDHRGSPRFSGAGDAAALIEERYGDTPLLIRHPEIFMRLPENPLWLYYPLGGTEELLPEQFRHLTPEQECYAVIQNVNAEELVLWGSRVHDFAGKYELVDPPASCTTKDGRP